MDPLDLAGQWSGLTLTAHGTPGPPIYLRVPSARGTQGGEGAGVPWSTPSLGMSQFNGLCLKPAIIQPNAARSTARPTGGATKHRTVHQRGRSTSGAG